MCRSDWLPAATKKAMRGLGSLGGKTNLQQKPALFGASEILGPSRSRQSFEAGHEKKEQKSAWRPNKKWVSPPKAIAAGRHLSMPLSVVFLFGSVR
jgi:hypothetical protein